MSIITNSNALACDWIINVINLRMYILYNVYMGLAARKPVFGGGGGGGGGLINTFVIHLLESIIS